jgi:truncated hemoglobin YjbI
MTVKKEKFCAVFAALRRGNSLYAACLKNGLTTREFYEKMAGDKNIREEYSLALADYADQCCDDIRAITEALKSGETDTSTAKLLIETAKWLAQKVCPSEEDYPGSVAEEKTEIVVKFI